MKIVLAAFLILGGLSDVRADNYETAQVLYQKFSGHKTKKRPKISFKNFYIELKSMKHNNGIKEWANIFGFWKYRGRGKYSPEMKFNSLELYDIKGRLLTKWYEIEEPGKYEYTTQSHKSFKAPKNKRGISGSYTFSPTSTATKPLRRKRMLVRPRVILWLGNAWAHLKLPAVRLVVR